MNRVRAVVLSGGSGTRLWPLSVGSRPKQFLELLGGSSLFAEALERAEALPGAAGTIVVAGSSHQDLVAEAAEGRGVTTLLEPSPRNTAPAIAAAAITAEPDDVLVIMPSDHLIADDEAFAGSVSIAVELAAAGGVVAFGCVADRPETGYGWIRAGEPDRGGFRIAEFVEKPDADRAGDLLSSGYLWNSGIFVVRADKVLSEIVTPGLMEAVRAAVDDREGPLLGRRFLDSPAISFDHAVMERTGDGRVVPLDAGWNDIGSWQAVWEVTEKDDNGNVSAGSVYMNETTNSLVRSTTRPVTVIGVDGIVVVETEDGVLVVPRERAQDVKDAGQHFGDGRSA